MKTVSKTLKQKDSYYMPGSGGSYRLWISDDGLYGEFGWEHDPADLSGYSVYRSTEFRSFQVFLEVWEEKREYYK